jgi:hypothetical protein
MELSIIDAITSGTVKHAQLIKGDSKEEWLYSTANEFGRLTKVLLPHMSTGTETMRYIHHSQLPKGRRATYDRCVSPERPYKS